MGAVIIAGTSRVMFCLEKAFYIRQVGHERSPEPFLANLNWVASSSPWAQMLLSWRVRVRSWLQDSRVRHHRRKVDEEHSGEISGNQNRIYFWEISYEKQIAHPGHVDCGNHRRFRFDLRTSRDGHFV